MDKWSKLDNKCIVLIGPECSGKSTQARILTEESSGTLIKHVRIPDKFVLLNSVIRDIEHQLTRTRLGVHGTVIFDRWQLTDDIIYEEYCYGEKSILLPLLPTLGATCREANIQILYLTIDRDEMISRLNARGDKLRTLDEAIDTWNAYETFYSKNKYTLPIKRLDVTGMTVEQLTDSILDII